jgi:hypothetical protein
MKKFIAIFVILAMCSISFAQLQVVNQKQITINKGDEISVMELGQKGFVVFTKSNNEDSKKLKDWTFTLYSPDIEAVWEKKLTLDKFQELLTMDSYNGDINIVYYDGIISQVEIITLVKISAEGEISKKEINLKNKIGIEGAHFINGNCYLISYFLKYKQSALARTCLNCLIVPIFMGITQPTVISEVQKADFSSLTLTSNKIQMPEYGAVTNHTSDGKNIYLRVKSSKKKFPYDAIYNIEDGVVMEKTPIKKVDNTEIEYMNVIIPDSAHKFVLGLSKKEVLGARKKDDKTFYQYYITNLEKDDIQTINKVDKDISNELFKDRNVSIKNKFFGTNYLVRGSGDIMSSCFRFNGKNFVVFDKYQKIYSEHTNCNGKTCYTYYVFESYYYTNTIVWCFNDEGDVEWSKNFEYDIVSPYYHAKTCARPYKDNTIALIGHFDNELSYKTLSMDGDVVEGTEKQKVSNKSKFSDLTQFNNSITHLYENTYLVWGNDDDNKSGDDNEKSKARKKEDKKKKTLNLIFKIIEFK